MPGNRRRSATGPPFDRVRISRFRAGLVFRPAQRLREDRHPASAPWRSHRILRPGRHLGSRENTRSRRGSRSNTGDGRERCAGDLPATRKWRGPEGGGGRYPAPPPKHGACTAARRRTGRHLSSPSHRRRVDGPRHLRQARSWRSVRVRRGVRGLSAGTGDRGNTYQRIDTTSPEATTSRRWSRGYRQTNRSSVALAESPAHGSRRHISTFPSPAIVGRERSRAQ